MLRLPVQRSPGATVDVIIVVVISVVAAIVSLIVIINITKHLLNTHHFADLSKAL